MNKISRLLLLLAPFLNTRHTARKRNWPGNLNNTFAYVETNNFSGRILGLTKGENSINKALRICQLEFKMPNELIQSFHLASISKTLLRRNS